MDSKNVIIALLTLCAAAYGQTRALYIGTNNVVIPGVNVTFNGAINFSTNTQAAATRSNLSLGLPALTNTSNAGLLSALGGLATNGDGGGLTNLPSANLTNATGILPIVSGGTGQTNAEAAIEALLPAYTNNADKILALNSNATGLVWTTNAGGGGSGSVTNVDASGGSTGLTFSGGPITNGGTLTLGGTLNLASGGTGGTNASEARAALELGTAATNDATAFQPASTNLDTLASNNAINLTNFPAGLATYPSFSNNAGLVLAVNTNETGVEWIAVSNTVTDASTLTNFPADLLRTNGDAAGLTNFPTLNQNTTGTASNVTGIVQITNGGTGTNSAAGARVNLLPSYTGNSNKVLAVNSGETDVEWIAQSGGGGGLTSPVAVVDGGTGATNATQALTNFTILGTNNRVTIGQTTTNTASNGIVIGNLAYTDAADSITIGNIATSTSPSNVVIGANSRAFASASRSVVIGENARSVSAGSIVLGSSTTNSSTGGILIGDDASAIVGSGQIVIGSGAYVSNSTTPIVIGYSAGDNFSGATNPIAIGRDASAPANSAIAIGAGAIATAASSIQLGGGSNSGANTIQFLSAGTVDTNEWARIAALSTYPTTNISVVGTNNTNTLVFSNGILVEVQ
jgi:hypothetical protein